MSLNETDVRQSIKWLFGKRTPMFPPEAYVLDAWVDCITSTHGLSFRAFTQACEEYSKSEGKLDTGPFMTLLRGINARLREEAESEAEAKKWEGRDNRHKETPKAATMAIEAWKDSKNETREETVRRQDALLQAMREEAAKHEKGSGLRNEWVNAGKEYRAHCDAWRVVNSG